MARKLSVTIVGPGSLGGALAPALKNAGFRVQEVVYRSDKRRAQTIAKRAGAKPVSFSEARIDADIIWISVGDRAISETAKAIGRRANWKGKYVFHSSGALSSDELRSLGSRGAKVASVHPMMSFVRKSESSFKGVSFALEGDTAARKVAAGIAVALGGTSFQLKKKDKPLYHALGAFSSPLLVGQLAAAEKIGRALGLKPEQTRKVIAPILQKTLSNYLEHGPASAFSGPMIRGDLETISRNLAALKRVSGTREIYRALAELAVRELPVKDRAATLRLLRR